MPLLEDDEESGTLESNSQDQLSGAQTFGFSSSRGAANPYTGQLQTLLTKYLENTEKAATDKQALLDKARERVMARSAGPDQAEMAFRLAAALGKPTRTGSFGETLGNVAETTGEALSQRRKANQELEDLNLKYQLAASDAKGEGQKAQISALSALARSTPKDRLTELEKMQEIIDDPKASDSSKKNAQARITYLTTRSGGTTEIDRIVSAVNDPKTSPAAKKAYEARLRKLTYIAPTSGEGGKPMSPAGKLASDEGLTPGTPEYQARVKALAGEGKGMNLSAQEQKELFEAEDVVKSGESVILNLSKAKELSPKAYEGFGAGARRTIARNIPGAGNSEGVTATTELETLVGENSLSQLKAIFGGAPTEGERKILLDLQGSISMSDAERQKIYDRALKAAARRVKSNQEKMERIRKGSYSRVAPEEKADGGFVGRYADGGLVAHYADGGGVTPESIRSQIEAGPRTQAALDQALMKYEPAQLAAAFPEYGNVADYNNAAREAYARVQQQMQQQNREDVRADMAAKGEEMRIANPGGDVQISGPAYPTMSAIPQAELDAARAKLSPDQQNFIDWRIRQINPMTHQRIGDEFARQGSNPYLDASVAQEQIDRYGRRSELFSQAGVTPEVSLAPWADPNWREKQDAAEKAEAARQAQMKADWEKIPADQRPVVGGGIVSPSSAGSTSSGGAAGASFVAPKSNQPDIEYLSKKYIGGPTDIRKYGQFGMPFVGEHLFFEKESEKEPTKMARGGPVRMADGGEMSLANLGRAVGQGLGLGFGDEAIARVRAKMEGRPYDDVVREEREAYQKFQEKNPFVALGTELVSGAIPTIGMAMIPGAGTPGAVAGAGRMGMAASKLAQYMPKFMTGSMGKAAGAGATTGAIAGAGSETEGNRTSGALSGGATGAVLGPTVAKGIQLGGQGVSAVKNAIRPSPNAVEQRATNKVLEAMGRDEMDLQGLRDKMMADKKLGVKSTIMDATPSMSTLGEAVVTRPGPGRKVLGQGLNERLEGGREAVGARTMKDIAKGVDYTAQEDKLIGTLRSNANNLYDTAYAHGSVDDTRILKVLEDDTFKKAFKEAQAISSKEARAAELRGEDPTRFKLNDIYEQDKDGNLISVGKIPDVRTLDYIKRGIDALIDKGYKGEGMGKAEANALKDLRKAYIGVIDENVPEYAAARAKYAGDMEVLDALRLGRTDYLTPKMLPAEAKKLVDGMSEAERDALRAGVAQSVLTKIMDAPQQINAAQRVIGAPATRKRLEALFQDPNEYKVFEAALTRESELFRNAQDIVRGSRTANKNAAMADLKAGNGIFDIAGEAVDIAAGSPGSVVGRVLKYLQARTSLDEKTAGEVAKMLKSGTTQEVDDTLKRLESSSAKFLEDKNTSARRLKTTSGTVGAAAPTTRLASPESEAPADEDDDAKLQRLLEKYSTEE
jgi:hypothetical protein